MKEESENHFKRNKSWGLRVNENFFWKVKQTALKFRNTHTHTQNKFGMLEGEQSIDGHW